MSGFIGRNTVVNLAENNNQFLREFVAVYTKMIEKMNNFLGVNLFCHKLVINVERYYLQVLNLLVVFICLCRIHF